MKQLPLTPLARIAKALVFSSLLFLSQPLIAQQHNSPALSGDYFITTTDTVLCESLSYRYDAKGRIKQLEYKTLAGAAIRLQGKKNLPDIVTIHRGNATIDKVPKKVEEPLGAYSYLQRRVDGKLKLFIEHDQYLKGDNGAYAKTNSFCYLLKFPDGTFVNVDNKENMAQIIIPYLKQCEAFVQAYKGTYHIGEEGFSEMIGLYNSLCAD